MDEKTEELRDIFMSVSDDGEVTESQAETHGSLLGEADVNERLLAVVREMREQVGFDTTLDDESLVTVVRGFYAGESDAEIARDLDDESLAKSVGRARIDLHLLRDRDEEAPFPLAELRETLEETDSIVAAASALDVSESTVRRYARVLEAREEIRRVNDRFRAEFENVLQDRELSERMTREVHEKGLEGATEGQETDTNL
ncbi:MAG: conditioned medium-induced protein 4 [Halanaeroarchaeum sp.]